MATPTPTKSMSSRLLTMKFMQRAAATPSTPTTPDTDEQTSKRRKVAHKSTSRENKDQVQVAQINQAAVQAAIAEEERKRQEALIQHAAELGDARWVLEIPEKATSSGRGIQTPMNIVQVGFAQIDSQIDSSDATDLDVESTDASQARASMVRRYNMSNKKVSKQGAPKDNESASDSSDSDSDSESDASSQEYTPGRDTKSQRPETQSDSPKSILRRKRSVEQVKAKQFADKRRKKEVKLNSPKPPSNNSGGLLSISSGGGTPTRPALTCYRCGKPGHRSAECKSTPKRSAH